MQYNRARWYDPAVGRWLSEDPIGFAASDANLYRYVGNGATASSDPSGLQTLGGIERDLPPGVEDATMAVAPLAEFFRFVISWSHGEESRQTDLDLSIIGLQSRLAQSDTSNPFRLADTLRSLTAGSVTGASNAAGTLVGGYATAATSIAGGAVIRSTGARAPGSTTSRTQTIKSVNLPSARKVKIDIEHIISGHVEGGARVSAKKDLFPNTWTRDQIERYIRDAYKRAKRLHTQGERVLVSGESHGQTIEMWVNIETKTIETAYPAGHGG